MSSIDKVPVPQESGSDGRQVAAEVVVEEMPDNNIGSRLLLSEIEGVASRGRGFGNGMGNALVLGAFRMLEAQCRKSDADLRRCQAELEQIRSELSQSRTNEEVLRERLASLVRTRNFTNAAMVIGSLLIGVGFDNSRGGSAALGIALMAFGGALVVLSWMSGSRGDNR